MKAAETFKTGVARWRALDGLSVPELRVELAEARLMRAMLDALDTRIVSLLETATRAVGTHEQRAAETSMRGEVLSPKARRAAVRISEIVSPVSPLLRARCPHRRMERNCSLSSTMTGVARDGDDDAISRVASLSTFGTDVCGEICPTVPHPLGRVDP
jgi:hypothetical protein